MEKNESKETKNTEKAATIERDSVESNQQAPCILEEIRIEELAIDGICGVY